MKVWISIPFDKAQHDIKRDKVVFPLSVEEEDITQGIYQLLIPLNIWRAILITFSKRGLVLPLLLPNNLLTSYSDEEKELGTTCSINSILAIPPASSLIHSTDSHPSIHLGQVIGLRLISKISEVQKNNTCVILGCESVECMRLEAGGMANMELIEQVVPNSFSTSEYDVSKLLGSSRGNTSPLFENTIKIALQIFNGLNN